jgi:hypothetical protein
VAKILSDDEIGSELCEQIGIDRVDTFPARDKLNDLAIDFGGKGVRIDARPNQRRLLRRLRRKIAFVRDADNGIAKAEGVENFGGRWQQRTDAHPAVPSLKAFH